MKKFEEFEKIIKIKFKDQKLLKQAFVHRSYLNENPPSAGGLSGHNERLEFLGDAVLELATTEYLYKKYPDKTEGDMTGFRASLVNAIMLSEVANEIGMSDFLLYSKVRQRTRARRASLSWRIPLRRW
jgi:ribonuclease-3